MFENSSFTTKNSNEANATQNSHPDLEKNRQYAKTLIERISSRLVEGLRLALVDHGCNKESLLWVKFKPPTGIAEGDYAHPIHLNGSHAVIKASLEFTFNYYHRLAKDFWERRNKSKIVDLKKAG